MAMDQDKFTLSGRRYRKGVGKEMGIALLTIAAIYLAANQLGEAKSGNQVGRNWIQWGG